MAFHFIETMKSFSKLKENYEFRRAYKKGKSFVSPFLIIYATKNRRGGTRLGITAGKKIGGAVQRNRAKRLMREAYRHIESAAGEKLKKGFLIVIAARTGINGVKCAAVESDLKYALKKAELLLQ